MEAIFTDNEEELKKLSLNINKKDIKARLRQSIISNSPKIYDQLLKSRNVETQIAIVNIIIKAMNKEDIRSSNLLNVHNKRILSVQKNNKNSLLSFLKEFSMIEPECRVVGVEVDLFKIRDREINGGFLFMGDENFRFQKDNEVVIIQFKSIENVLFNGIDLTILATEGRKVEIKFMYKQDLGKFKERVMCKFTQADAEESIMVEIGKKVTFSPEIKVKEKVYGHDSISNRFNAEKEDENHIEDEFNISPVKSENKLSAVSSPREGSDDRTVHLNSPKERLSGKTQHFCDKMPIKNTRRPISKDKSRCKNSKVKPEKCKKQHSKNKSRVKTKKKLKVFKKNRAMPDFKKKNTLSFKKEKCFDRLKDEIREIYKDKLKLAKLVYKSMKEDAIKFKESVESIEKRSVYRIK